MNQIFLSFLNDLYQILPRPIRHNGIVSYISPQYSEFQVVYGNYIQPAGGEEMCMRTVNDHWLVQFVGQKSACDLNIKG